MLVLAPGPLAAATAVVFDPACQANTLAANDDGSTGSIALPFSINFFGTTYSSLYVNNNGNLTFNAPLGIYTPFGITTAVQPIIAPFFADVDTRGAASGLVHWGTTTFDGHPAFCATWADVQVGVGYYPGLTDKLNTFQVLLVDRGAGDFDIVFNYNSIQWETGGASGGVKGLGGQSARVGFSNGTTDPTPQSYELPGSGVPGSFLDPGGLVAGSRNSSVAGRYIFPVRNGTVIVDPGNSVWPHALQLDTSGGTASATGIIGTPGQARWYRFDAPPGSEFSIDATSLPANYDLAVFKDIGAAYVQLTSTDDLLHLAAAGEAVAPSQFAPSQFAPSQFAPSQFAPSQFAPSQFAPSQFAPSQFAPSQFAPSQFAPSQFAPTPFDPATAPPAAFSPEAFASAQVASLIGLSAHDGTADENVTLNTWNDSRFYVRVTGRNGDFSPQSFGIKVTLAPSVCTGIAPSGSGPAPFLAAVKTVILTDSSRIAGSSADKATLRAKLDALAARSEVAGAVVDVASDTRIQSLEAQADSHPACPYAKNLVASAIKDIVDAYRPNNPQLRYVVIAGNDRAIPFFRYPDQAGLGPESQYAPPVADTTASQAALRLDYVLSQDAYGAKTQLSVNSTAVPIPDLGVGRLVETPAEMSGLVDAYLGTSNGVVPTPHSSLVTGYDFLADAAGAVEGDLAAGLGSGATNDTLITNQGIAPTDVGSPPLHSWTADQLRTKLLGSRHDLIFLGGHFSANNALAADFATTINSTALDSSTVDLANSIVFSAGCHAGYNIVDDDAIPNVTVTEDWAQAFARKKATLIAGTGYQYGDSDFLEYSERLYSNFAHALRLGTGAVSVGDALVRAKQDYLNATPSLRGMHTKALLEATLFGLPMLSVSLPAGRIAAPADASVIHSTSQFASDPAARLGLSSADLTLSPSLADRNKQLTNVTGGSTITASWLSGPDGIVTNPGEPALPLAAPNVSVPGQVLRGVGFRGGSYSDTTGLTPLTGAPATESPGVHTAFLPQIFFPRRLWTVNYFDALSAGAATGTTRLMVTPAQYRGDGGGAQTSTLRRFSSLALRLYYSANVQTYGSNTPGQSAAPTIAHVSTDVAANTVTFKAQVVGDPSAGIQEVWVVYTGLTAGRWEPLDLHQSATDSTLWSATLPLGAVNASTLHYAVQAVNGVGLVTLDDNLGAYYSPGAEPGAAGTQQPPPTTLALTAPATGRYGETISLSAQLTSGGVGVANAGVMFSVGGLSRSATTDGNGTATVSLPLLLPPRTYNVGAGFDGDATHGSSSGAGTITVTKAPTTLSLAPLAAVIPRNSDAGNDVIATLRSGDAPIRDQSVLFVVRRPDTSVAASVLRSTDYLGRARLEPIDLAPATGYVVTAYFGGQIVLPTGTVVLDNRFYDAAAAAAATVQVVDYHFGGLLWPILNPPQLTTWVSGLPVPVRFSLGLDAGLAIFAAGYPQSQPIDCATKEPTGPAEATAMPSGVPLVFVRLAQQYLYTWKTSSTYTGCRQLVLRFTDGVTYKALFKFKRDQ